jgi:septal ring factor EnvC (AmiA/AmiB activator)
MKGRVQEAREKAWLSTPEGKKTQEKYESDMKAWQRKKSEFGRQYAMARDKVEGQYELVRDEFRRKRKARPAATATATATTTAGGH